MHIFIAVLVASRLLDTSGQEEQREETDVPNSEMHTGREQTKVKDLDRASFTALKCVHSKGRLKALRPT